MPDLAIGLNFYAASDADGGFRNGMIFHVERNASGGSVSTPIARYFTTRPDVGAEGYHSHERIDCIVRDHPLAPAEDWLGRQLADVLLARQVVTEPIWVSWHRATEIGGEARGHVFDFD
jgi:hypothetical protein